MSLVTISRRVADRGVPSDPGGRCTVWPVVPMGGCRVGTGWVGGGYRVGRGGYRGTWVGGYLAGILAVPGLAVPGP